MRKLSAIIFLFCLTATILTGCQPATKNTSAIENTSQYTDGIITATLDKESGILTFSGNGAVDDTHIWLKLQEKAYIREVIFEEGITSIGNCEFNNSYPNLAKVTFKGNINVIGSCAFADNPNLAKVKFLGSCKAIEDLAFFKCYSLEEVNLPSSCNIENNAFSRTPLEQTANAPEPPTNTAEPPTNTDSNETDFPTPTPPPASMITSK